MSVEDKNQSQEQPKQKAIEEQVSERIAGYIHEIDSLRGTIRELVEKIKEGKEGSGGKQLYEFVKASEELPPVNKEYNCLLNGNVPKTLFFEKGWNFYYYNDFNNAVYPAINVIEWLKPIITEQGNDRQILLTKIQEQEIEIASLKNKVKDLENGFMGVQEEMQNK